MSPDFFYTRLLWDSELHSAISLSKLHFLRAFTSNQALNAPHPTEWLNAVWPELFRRFFLQFFADPVALCWAVDSKELSRPCPKSAIPSTSRREKKNRATHWVTLQPKVAWGKETGEIRVVMEREKEVEGTWESKEMIEERKRLGKQRLKWWPADWAGCVGTKGKKKKLKKNQDWNQIPLLNRKKDWVLWKEWECFPPGPVMDSLIPGLTFCFQ